VRERGYKNIRTISEQVAQFDYRPVKCKKTYRVVVLRKNLTVERGEQALFDDIRYFFYTEVPLKKWFKNGVISLDYQRKMVAIGVSDVSM